MQKLAEICIERPVFATMLIMALVVTGLASYLKLGVDLFPKIEFPIVTVTTPCAAPRPKKWKRRSPSASKKPSTPSAASTSCAPSRPKASRMVSIQFVLEKDADVAAQEVRDKVAAVLSAACPRTPIRRWWRNSPPTRRR